MYVPYGSYGEWGMGSTFGWFGGGIMMLIFWVLFIALIVWLVREVGDKNTHSHSNSQALAILKERYAKGEISREEFETKKKDIS